MKLFIGTNYGHGAAIAAINESGELVFAVEEGRLVGEKDCDRFPTIALHMILNKFSPDTLQWAEGWDRWKRFINKGILTTLKYGIFDTSYYRARLIKEIYRLYNGLNIEFEWRRLLNTPSFTGHHLAHAFSLLPWGLPAKSLILISDTTAESAAISIFYWCGSTMYLLLDVPYPHSPGAAFHQMAVHLGFRGRTAPGKLMALAAYGQPKWVDELRSFCKITNQGFRFDLNHYPAWHRKSAWRRFATNSASRSLRDAILSRIDCGDQGCDLARSVQDWFTVITLDIIRHSLYIARNHHGFEVKHIGLAGGSALNCHTNGQIIKNSQHLDIESIVISPWSDDPGTAIGAAAWLFHQKSGSTPKTISNSFLGPPAINNFQTANASSADIKKAAKVLQDGGIVALITGFLEFGPRALGGRCLLGDPRNTSTRDRLNAIKGRPKFMPFAPVILECDFSKYFIGRGSVNMAWTVESTPLALRDIPAAIHVNGEARVQLLKDGTITLLSRLLTCFRTLTGIGALLLTSLNGKDEPIAADISIAEKMAQRMGINGILCDSGWYSYSETAVTAPESSPPPSPPPSPASPPPRRA